MLTRKIHPNGMVTLQSPLLEKIGVPHAFSTRHGAGDRPMDLGQASIYQEQNEAALQIRSNLSALLEGMNTSDRKPIIVRQVHGKGVYQTPADLPETYNEQADAIMTDHPDAIAVIRVADCVPILLSDESGKHVAAVHAGWRGVVANIVDETIIQMRTAYALGIAPLYAAIGPCISLKHFEIGDEVVEAFEEATLGEVVEHEAYTKAHIDLTQAVKLQLMRAEIPLENIDTHDGCTFADADDFYSYRREAKLSGRLASLIGVRKS